MYFIDRLTLGSSLAKRLPDIRGKEAIIVCLKESALLTCIQMATELRAYIYPLMYEPIPRPDDPTHLLGAITQEGEFCRHPDISIGEMEFIYSEYVNAIEAAKQQAMQRMNRRTADYEVFDKHVLNGRPVVLVGDIVTNHLELSVAKMLLKPLQPATVYGVIGNTTIDISCAFRLATNTTDVLDILPSIVMDDAHYFEKPDPYSDEEKRQLALNISTYWA